MPGDRPAATNGRPSRKRRHLRIASLGSLDTRPDGLSAGRVVQELAEQRYQSVHLIVGEAGGDEVIDDRDGVLDVGEHLVACRREP